MAFYLAEPFKKPYVPPSWSTGTDAEIVEALQKHYAGEIDLTECWSVGDERTVSLSAMAGNWNGGSSGESHAAQDVTFVIMNVDNGVDAVSNPNYNYQLVTPINGHTRPAFIVGQKGLLFNGDTKEGGTMDGHGWDDCSRRTWCNSVYKNAIPSTIRDIFKQVGVKAGSKNDQSVSSLLVSNDYFFYVAEKEVFGSCIYSYEGEANALSQFEYYEIVANRIKNNYGWWTRSIRIENISYYVNSSGGGVAGYDYVGYDAGIALHACI